MYRYKETNNGLISKINKAPNFNFIFMVGIIHSWFYKYNFFFCLNSLPYQDMGKKSPPPIYRVSQKHGNSVTNWISSLLWISIVVPNFKSHNIIMSARVYFMKRVKDCKDVSIMYPQDEQWRLEGTASVCILQFSCFTNCTTVCSQNINKQNVNIADETLRD